MLLLKNGKHNIRVEQTVLDCACKRRHNWKIRWRFMRININNSLGISYLCLTFRTDSNRVYTSTRYHARMADCRYPECKIILIPSIYKMSSTSRICQQNIIAIYLISSIITGNAQIVKVREINIPTLSKYTGKSMSVHGSFNF